MVRRWRGSWASELGLRAGACGRRFERPRTRHNLSPPLEPFPAAAMSLIEHYATLRQVHIGFVTASGTLFALRAFATLGGARWPLRLPARAASWVVDTGLLSAGTLLLVTGA